MSAKTVDDYLKDYLERGIAKSLILGFLERGEVDDPKQPPKTASYVADLGSIPGINRELANLLENEPGRDGCVKRYARLNYTRIKKKEAQAGWEHHRDAQPNLPKNAIPTGRFAREIARWRAAEKVCEMESRALHKRLQELMQAEEEQRKRKAESLRWKGIGKIANHNLVMMDGRKVVQNEQGENVFGDDGSSVAEYLEEVKKRKRQKFADERVAA